MRIKASIIEFFHSLQLCSPILQLQCIRHRLMRNLICSYSRERSSQSVTLLGGTYIITQDLLPGLRKPRCIFHETTKAQGTRRSRVHSYLKQRKQKRPAVSTKPRLKVMKFPLSRFPCSRQITTKKKAEENRGLRRVKSRTLLGAARARTMHYLYTTREVVLAGCKATPSCESLGDNEGEARAFSLPRAGGCISSRCVRKILNAREKSIGLLAAPWDAGWFCFVFEGLAIRGV